LSYDSHFGGIEEQELSASSGSLLLENDWEEV
jgi:hypothetical protein